jgi:hypothetical protein
MAIIADAKRKVSEFIDNLLVGERYKNLQDLLSESERWKPKPTNSTYHQEMTTRVNYYFGAMQSDMQEELKRRFPETYSDIEKEQLNMPLVKKTIDDKAKVFLNTGEFYLADENDERATGGEVGIFEQLQEDCLLRASLKQADAITQLCHRSMVKPWWDPRSKKVRINIFAPHITHIVPNPLEHGNADAALAVLFELPSLEGLLGTKKRYEVWGYRDPKAAEATQQNTLHFITDGQGDHKINSEDINPFVDPNNENKPIYPFVWWKDDASTELYTTGFEDMLTPNRALNSALTDIRHGLHFQTHPMLVHRVGEGSKEFSVTVASPNKIASIGANDTLEVLTYDLNLTEVWNFWKEVMQHSALMQGVVPSSVQIDAQTPESGYHLKLRNMPMVDHRSHMIDIYREAVIETVRRVIIVNNFYNTDATISLEKYHVVWVPGELGEVEDPEHEGRVYAAEKEANVSTSVDWRMARYDEDYETAKQAVLDNAEFNKVSNAAGKQASPFEQGGRAGSFADQMFAKDDEEEEKPDEETEEEKPKLPA